MNKDIHIVEMKPRPLSKRARKPQVHRKHKKGIKTPGRAKLIKRADSAMSLYIRQKYADKDGIVQCYTCPYKAHWKKMQNGHYITRSLKYTRWDENNCRPQCFVCNMRNQGMSHLFRENLVKEISEFSVLNLEAAAKQLFREPDEYILNHALYYEEKIKQISQHI